MRRACWLVSLRACAPHRIESTTVASTNAHSIIDAVSAIIDAAYTTIISSAAAAWSSPDGRWPPSLDAAGAISISAIVAFSSTSTAAAVTICWQQLSKVSFRLLDPFEHMPHVPLSCPRSMVVLADSDLHAITIVLSVMIIVFLTVTARSGRGREPRLDPLDAPLDCAVPRQSRPLRDHLTVRACVLSYRAGRVSQAIFSRVAFSWSFSVPVVQRSLANSDMHGHVRACSS